MTKKFAVSDVYCHDATKSAYPISTGIGYLDHMIDQLNSHAQVGVSVTVIVVGNDDDDDDTGISVSYFETDQYDIPKL